MDGCIDLTAEASDDEGPVRPSERRLPAHSLERQDRDLAAAIAASLASSAPPPTTMQASSQGGSTRLEMEKERLARQSKRTAEGASSSLAKAWVESPHKRRHIHSLADLVPSSSSSSSHSSSVSPVKSDSRRSRRTDVRYWKGDVKQVQNQFHPDSPLGSMSFADVVGPVDELEHAVLSSFAIDMDWVVPHFTANPNVNLLIVKGADPSQGPGIFSSTTPNVYALVPQPGKTATGTPMKQGINHIKFVVLCYKSFLRIVISSANAVDYDYDLMDNVRRSTRAVNQLTPGSPSSFTTFPNARPRKVSPTHAPTPRTLPHFRCRSSIYSSVSACPKSSRTPLRHSTFPPRAPRTHRVSSYRIRVPGTAGARLGRAEGSSRSPVRSLISDSTSGKAGT